MSLARKTGVSTSSARKIGVSTSLDRKTGVSASLDKKIGVGSSLDRKIEVRTSLSRKTGVSTSLAGKSGVRASLAFHYVGVHNKQCRQTDCVGCRSIVGSTFYFKISLFSSTSVLVLFFILRLGKHFEDQ